MFFAAQARGALLADAPLALQLRRAAAQPQPSSVRRASRLASILQHHNPSYAPIASRRAALPGESRACSTMHEDIRVRRPSVPGRCFPRRTAALHYNVNAKPYAAKAIEAFQVAGKPAPIGSNAPHPNDEDQESPATRCRQPRDCVQSRAPMTTCPWCRSSRPATSPDVELRLLVLLWRPVAGARRVAEVLGPRYAVGAFANLGPSSRWRRRRA